MSKSDNFSRRAQMLEESMDPNKIVDASILIVCYKSRDFIADCLRGVYEYTRGVSYEVLLVDCSNDGTLDLVRSQFPQTTIFADMGNLGFAKGNNFLAEKAQGKFLILLNPDVIVKDDAIGELYRTAVAMPKAAAVGGRARLPDGRRDPGSRQAFPSLFRLFISVVGGARLLNGALSERATEPAEVETLSGAFMLVRTEAWRSVGGFDTDFFMYSEEMDLCHRLRRQGNAIVMTPRAEVIHFVGGGDSQNPRRIGLITQARMHFIRKCWGKPQALVGGALIWLHGFVRWSVATIGMPLIGRARANRLRNAYSGIVFEPKHWWNGFGPENRS